MTPSPDQLEAINDRAPDLTIRAGAGAGKTGVLVERYLRHVLDEGAHPDEILAITYTRKAAAEMKRRIVERLRTEGRWEAARQAQVGPISTVHGYCERLLREYPFDAGVDPKFDVLSDTQSADLLRECARRALADPEGLSEAERAIVHRFGGERPWISPTDEASAKLIQYIGRTVEKYRTAGKTPEDLEAVGPDTDGVLEGWWKYILRQAEAAFGGPLPEGREWDLEAVKNAFKASGGKLPPWLSRPPDEAAERTLAELAAGLASLSAQTWRLLLGEFERLRVLDFAELEARACRLLEERPDTIRGKYRWLMADEAQDLNPIQYRILKRTPAENRLFVGDAQQSIYRFRGAERELFMQETESSICRMLVTNWRCSGRILRVVDEVFFRQWGDEYVRMRPRRNGAESDAEDPFADTASDYGDPVEVWRISGNLEDQTAKGIHALVSEGIRPGDITVLVPGHAQVDPIATRLGRHGIPFLVLGSGRHYFLRTEVRDLGSALHAVCDPSDSLALLSLLRSPLVGVSLDGVLRIGLDAKRAKLSVYEQIRAGSSQLAAEDAEQVSEFLAWFEPLALCADRLSAWEALAEIFAATHLDARFAMMPEREQLIANSRKLLRMALERPELDPRIFGDWIAAQQRIRTRMADAETLSGDADAVRISTMHVAKGLEWEVVVVHAVPRGRRDDEDAVVVPESDLVTVKDRDYRPLAWQAASASQEQKEGQEAERLLYVAMTRAKRRLCVAVADVSRHRRDRWRPMIQNRLAPGWVGSDAVLVRDLTETAPTRAVAGSRA